jgi:ubiquinone/menaquinone biosynthesis C-methylase UbiE
MTTSTISPAILGRGAVRPVYTALAPVYDLWAVFTEERSRRRALEIAAVRDGQAVLEVAVGTGLAFEELVRANPHGRTVGIDLTPAMLSRARRRVERAGLAGAYQLEIGDAYALPFDDGSFDLVHNAYMFDLLPEPDFARVLGEMFRVLRPGGRLVVLDMAMADRWWQRVPEAFCKIGGCRGVELVPYVERAGFAGVQRETLVQMGFPSEIVSATKGASR